MKCLREMKFFQRSKQHPTDWADNVILGLCEIVDGMVRVCSFGLRRTPLVFWHSIRNRPILVAKPATGRCYSNDQG